MEFTVVSSLTQRKVADVIILPLWQEEKMPKAACNVKEFASVIAMPVEAGDFRGKEGETLLLYRGKVNEKRIMLVGLGPKKSCNEETLRKAYSAVVKLCRQKKIKKINLALPHVDGLDPKASCSAICEGLLLTNYSFEMLKGDVAKEEQKPLIEKVALIGADKAMLALCKKNTIVISAVNMARDLVNGNADDITPQALCIVAKNLAKEFANVKTSVLEKKELEKEKMGLLLAVGKGSAIDPALIVVEYQGAPASKDKTALVGKGITYDTGGLCIKPPSGMSSMKCDMAGGAAVLATIRAAAELKIKVNLIGVVPATENAIGSKSYKVGDVYRSYSGKTVEIGDTDAEGRLVLADAISYVQDKFKPSRIIDLGTLTGSIVIVLGEEATGLFTDDDKMACDLIQAGVKTFERLWRLPLYPEYKEYIRSSIADIKNVSGHRKAGASACATFIKQFVKKDMPWVHLDIAGTAYLSELKPYHTTYATGVGVRLLIEYLENLK